MTISLKARSRDGQTRPWTLKEIVQGKPLGHPSHALFVHFPVAFYIMVLGLDVASRIGNLPEAPVVATWLIIGAFVGSAGAVTSGLVDWWGLRSGSKARKLATRHMLLQLTTFGLFLANLIIRWPDRSMAQADVLWIVLGAVGVALLLVGQYLGGVMVYELGLRVGEAPPQVPREAPPQVPPSPPSAEPSP
jgi:uncharacterized membrane protein